MRQTRDSFLRLLADNITGGVPIHNVRRDPKTPDSDKLQGNAVNVSFVDTHPHPQVGETTVEIAVVHEDELTALDWVKKVYDVIGARYFTEKMDYTDPAAPITTGANIYWERNDVRFRSIYNDFYYDYRCTLTLRHTVDS